MPIVHELQQLASDGKASITDVLRKALIVASKLKIQDFREWIENELNGYRGKDVPEYRVVHGIPTVIQMYTGRQLPMAFESQEQRDHYSKMPIGDGVSEVEKFAVMEDGYLAVDYSAELQNAMNENNHVRVGRYCCIIQPTTFVGIIDRVRNIILQWSLKLEDQGILGDGMSFSDAEKQAAKNSPSVHIGAVYGQVRMNNDSTDNSTNYVSVDASSVFNTLRNEVQKIADAGERAEVLAKVTALEKSKDKKSAGERFLDLTTLTANSVAIAQAVTPFVPSIMAWIATLG